MNQVIWKDSNPSSAIFDDIYFSIDGGFEESHYVFIDGNNLLQRWQNYNGDFTIIETGFGTGLNFFAAYQLWQSLNISGTLNYISIEKHPFSKEDIKKTIGIYPELSSILDKFLEQYPSSFIQLENCNISIVFEDIKTALPKITSKADAWFLDGFSPAKNPDMWCEQLYKTMNDITKKGGTLATFTCAGHVRRGLQENGFQVEKKKGFGKKRSMLTGYK
jgi:tRNA 5-methylaminomethyl-2-thiouridine biosynthesis bifunctional protein